MSNSDDYLAAFARIEKWLRSETSSALEIPFSQVVRRAEQRHRSVSYWRNALLDLARLRNAIVHDSTDGQVIAEPNDRVVREIQTIASQLLAPPKVLPAFQRKVQTAERQWTIAQALSLMNRREFSQLPVQDAGSTTALLSTNTIARWLASQVALPLVDLNETTVEEVLGYAEYPDNFVFISRQSSFFDVIADFDRCETKASPLDAVLITHTGRKHESLLGIITHADLPKMYAHLRPR